jgi:hypothetical protein
MGKTERKIIIINVNKGKQSKVKIKKVRPSLILSCGGPYDCETSRVSYTIGSQKA